MATTDEGSSLLSTLTSALTAFVNFDAAAISQVLGLWFAARAAISTVASNVADIVTHGTVQGVQAQFLDIPLTPAQLADMAVRNIIAGGTTGGTTPLLGNIEGHDIYTEASYSGVSQQRMNALILDNGESYGILDALRLYNRGLSMYGLTKGPDYSTGTPLYTQGASLASTYGITEAELDTVIYYSRVRDQFVPDLLKLARNTLSPADAVELAVKQVVDLETATNLFVAAGGVAEQFEALVDGAGDSAGLEHAVSLAMHKVINSDQLKQIMGLSRLNPRFYYLYDIDAASGQSIMGLKWLSPYEISEAVKAGTVSAATAQTWLEQNGYDTAQASAFTTALTGGAVAKAKNETEGQVVDSYMAHQISEAQATTALQNLGYSASAIPFVLQSATSRSIISEQNRSLSRIRMSFLLGDLTDAQAVTAMSQLGVAQAAITAYINDWTAELNTPHEHLTEAMVGRLYSKGIMTEAVALQKWQAMGYTSEDAGYLLKEYTPA